MICTKQSVSGLILIISLVSVKIFAMDPIVLVHGGAGDIPDSRDEGKHRGAKLAARIGYRALIESGSVLDAVEAAVRSMELDDNFNAGYGSVLTLNYTVEMDASIMVGKDLSTGCVSIVKDILHPITLARKVMEDTPHNFLAGDGVMEFAKKQGIEILSPPGQLVTQRARDALEDFLENQSKPGRTEIGHVKVTSGEKVFGEVGTVGAVAIDADGNIAVATSTGGITGKYPGRVGDTPILGSGTYADNRYGGISTTGHGESIMKSNLAQSVIKRIAYLDEDAQTATKEAVDDMTLMTSGTAGAITIDKNGEIGIYFSSEKMSWAYQKGDTIYYGIREGDNFTEKA